MFPKKGETCFTNLARDLLTRSPVNLCFPFYTSKVCKKKKRISLLLDAEAPTTPTSSQVSLLPLMQQQSIPFHFLGGYERRTLRLLHAFLHKKKRRNLQYQIQEEGSRQTGGQQSWNTTGHWVSRVLNPTPFSHPKPVLFNVTLFLCVSLSRQSPCIYVLSIHCTRIRFRIINTS